MMRYGVSFSFADVFFSHFHTDHYLGIIGLLRTMALQGRTEVLRCWGPKGAIRVLRQCEMLGADRLTFPLEVRELEPGESVRRPDFAIHAVLAEHRGAYALSWALVEDTRRGRFNPDRARELGIPEGPLWGLVHRGQPVVMDDGRTVHAAELVGPSRAGRRVVITGDTRPCAATREASANADLLVHESTFGDEESQRARETGHSTAREAAELARDAGVRRLVLTHLSARYTRDVSELEKESRSVFPPSTIARDGMEVDVPFADLAAEATPAAS